MNNLQILTKQVNEIGYEIDNYKKRESNLFQKKDTEEQKIVYIDEAITVLTAVLTITQEGVIRFISEVVTSALQYVYGEEYSFSIKFQFKRNQPEVLLIPIKNGMEYSPRFTGGIGIIDVCSFALRCVMWALKEPHTDNVLVLDEPFKNLHGQKVNEKVGYMIKNLSELLGLQIIIISGESPIVEYADKIFHVMQEDDISFVTERINNA